MYAINRRIISTYLKLDRSATSMPFLPTVSCADVGSVSKNNFGWWSTSTASGNRPSELVTHIVSELETGGAVALGFECPLFVPINVDEFRLTAGLFVEV